MESKQRVDEGRIARAVGAEQADRAAGEGTRQAIEDASSFPRRTPSPASWIVRDHCILFIAACRVRSLCR